MTVVDAYASAGPADPSVRTRLIAWGEATGVQVRLHVASDPAGISVRARSHRGDEAREPVRLVLRTAARATRGRLEQRLLRRAGFGVYELDDGLPWDDGRLPGLGAWWKVPFRRDLVARRAAAAADRVIAGNETLADWASDHARDVVVIPTCVDLRDYDPKQDYEIGPRPRLLWMGGPATQPELERIAPDLRELHRRTGARLTVIAGGNAVSAGLAEFTDVLRWTPDVQRSAPARADVGLMPLRDGVYQRAKCGYKLLQYAAAGLPAVASPVGVNTAMTAAGIGFAAPDGSWATVVSRVIGLDPTERRRAAEHARRVVAERYSYSAHAHRWIAAVTPAGILIP
jgi:glycosyltransferase involved in cell wall biosynthesis